MGSGGFYYGMKKRAKADLAGCGLRTTMRIRIVNVFKLLEKAINENPEEKVI